MKLEAYYFSGESKVFPLSNLDYIVAAKGVAYFSFGVASLFLFEANGVFFIGDGLTCEGSFSSPLYKSQSPSCYILSIKAFNFITVL